MPGLRREEVALLAGVSVDYYTQIERGHLGGVSDSVLHGLAGVLQLDEAERAYLFDLAQPATTPARPRRPRGPQRVRPSLQRLLDAMTGVPAYVRSGRLDILEVNRLGSALYAPVLAGQPLPVNRPRFCLPGGAGLPGQLGGDPGPAQPTSDGPGARGTLTRRSASQIDN